MAAVCLFDYRLQVVNENGQVLNHQRHIRFSPGLGSGKRETITLTASIFTALSPPTGSKFLALLLGSAVSLTLKGITGDTGFPISPSASPVGFDLLVPLGATPVLGILNGSASSQVIEAIWF